MILVVSLFIVASVAQGGPSALADANGRPAPQSTPTERYTVTDLGTLGGESEARAINNVGQVAGFYRTGSGFDSRAFLWEDGVMQNLGSLGGDRSEAYGINDSGQVVGMSYTSSGTFRAFRWQNGVMQDLGTLGGTHSSARAINNAGQIVGMASTSAGPQHAFLWSGGMADLGALDYGSDAYGVNESGQVVGYAQVGTVDPWEMYGHAFLWNGSMQDLGTLGWAQSQANAINDNGQVVGHLVNDNQDDWHAFLSQGGGMQDLGGTQSVAYDINNAGLIVGESGGRAVLWDNGQRQDLNSLIPADSGWILSSARAINERGQIVGRGSFNGQTRAFLLSPRAYYWINPSGGSWHLSTNWDPQGDPGDGDTVIFALSGQYTVDASAAVAAAGPAANFPVGRMVISATNTVDFQNLALNLLDDSVTEPALTVSDGGTVKITSGAGNLIHATIGGAPPANPSNPPIARLQVFNSGTRLNGTGRLSIGGEGPGDLFVANGGHLTSAEARLGGLLSTAPGTAVVGGDGSLWQTGNIAVGYGKSGALTIENGGRVDSNNASVSYGILSEDSEVIIEGIGAGTSQPSLWAVGGDLAVGQSDNGSVEVLKGGQLAVNGNTFIYEGMLKVDNSNLNVLESVLIGGNGNGGILSMYQNAQGDIDGDLILGQSGLGYVILDDSNLDVQDPLAGLCHIGRESSAWVTIEENSALYCRNIQLGLAGTPGVGIIRLNGGWLSASEILRVGQTNSGGGLVELMNGARIVAAEGLHIAPNGTVVGAGDIFLGSIGLLNEGVLDPGITVHAPPRLPGAAASQSLAAQGNPATMTITGTLTISPTGRLQIPLTGSSAGEYGSLAITGAANLDGVLALNFGQGFAPKQGDTFAFLTATGGVSGAFDRVEIGGLAPGFEYKLTATGGQATLEALNDGTPPGRLFLPLVAH